MTLLFFQRNLQKTSLSLQHDIKWLLTENSKQKVFLEDSFLRDDSDASPFFPARFLLSQGNQGKSGNLKIGQRISRKIRKFHRSQGKVREFI